ncbi:IQ calmodulin-binding motif family protein [Tritrichomonas foetus]|uniref:IQ calmodulin-binding motif family protein n=1 Tax=Tritrichomonas foetus TaxID=1144522 RepID=A0A1J4JNN0_9EUKA|nr:IQ calmodulin-binding motif family protein [Tritrichomonas foetus]|eukprot:OHS99115.1 IQ calmodulin-binding motif family protein [Tritrichomonas foetus]
MHTTNINRKTSQSSLSKSLNQKPSEKNRPGTRFSGVDPSGPFTKNINMLKNSINFYKQKNNQLKETIDLLNGAMETMDERRALFKQFDKDLQEIFSRLDQRSLELTNAESKVKSFRQTPEGMSTIVNIPLSSNSERQKLLTDNEKLVQLALAQERQMVIMKMRLRLFHDHRDLSRLRRILNKLEGGGSDYREDEEITSNLKSSIQTLRKAIGRERERIRLLELNNMDDHDAATVIQKTWRGYYYRYLKNPKPKVEPQPTTPRSTAEEEEENGEAPRPDITPAPANEPM